MVARSCLPSGQVTFLFTDIEASTRLARMLGDGYRPVLNDHRSLLRRSLGISGGAEILTEGDSFFVAFAEADEALAACFAAQRALAEHPWPTAAARPRVRMGLHTGFAVPQGGEYASHEVHRAARVSAAAHGGQVLCSAATAREARALPAESWLLDLGLHRLRGFDDQERLYQLIAPGLERHFPRPRTQDVAPHNLPASTTSFVGRRPERVELRSLATAHRLVTVCGPGGSGKTRLAVEVAGDLVDGYPDGVWLVDLAGVTDPSLVPVAVATAFGLRPEPGRPMSDTLREYAARKRSMLLLDTCDQQPAATAKLVDGLLAGCRGLTVLATSREPLGLPGEVVWRIPPLSTDPAPDARVSDAVALLVDRAAAARGGRPPEDREMVSLDRVARRLDGLPLALELAAARLRVLSATQLAERIDDVFGTLDAGTDSSITALCPDRGVALNRHATLRATVDWSYRTLSPRAGRLLRWLAAFSGPVDLTAVEWLTQSDALDALTMLTEKSLVHVEHNERGATYRMLDTIQAYAELRLVEADEDESAHDRHAAWCVHAVEQSRTGTDGIAITWSMYALDPLAGEVRRALHWTATRGDVRTGLRLAAMLDQWWRERGLAREGRVWLFRLYERMSSSGQRVPDVELAQAYQVHSQLAAADREYGEELRFSQRAEVTGRRSGDHALVARIMAGRGLALLALGEDDSAEALCRRTIAEADSAGVSADALPAVYCLALLQWRGGDHAGASDLLAGARPLETQRPAVRGQRTVDFLLGVVALARGDLVAAHEHLVVALRSRYRHGFHCRAVQALYGVAVRCALGGDLPGAARLFGAAETAQRQLHASLALYGEFFAGQQAKVREGLGDAAFDARYAEGSTMSLDEAVRAGLAIEHPDLAAGSSGVAAGPLSQRFDETLVWVDDYTGPARYPRPRPAIDPPSDQSTDPTAAANAALTDPR